MIGRKKLSKRNKVFIKHFLDGCRAVDAYRLAGYRGAPHTAYELRRQLKRDIESLRGSDFSAVPDTLPKAVKKTLLRVHTVASAPFSYNVLLHKYGLSVKTYDDMLKLQGNKCGICGILPSGTRLFVDHCHENGEIRGLLCRQCNTRLWPIERNLQFVENAIAYLKGASV